MTPTPDVISVIHTSNIQPFQTNTTYDLDKDGIVDHIQVDTVNHNLLTITINQSILITQIPQIDTEYYLATLDFNLFTTQIIIPSEQKTHPKLNIFQYYNGKITLLGSIDGTMDEFKQNEDCSFSTLGSGNVLCSWSHMWDYRIETNETKDFSLTRIDRKSYPMNMTVTVKRKIPLFEGPGIQKIISILNPGDEVQLVSTDDTQWVYIKHKKNNQKGWLMVNQFTGIIDSKKIPAYELFEGLSFD